METDKKTFKNDKDESNPSESGAEWFCCDDMESCGYDVDPCECLTESCCC